jgi:hypothetical protein
MASSIQIDSKSRHAQLDPAFKEFLDVVVIPALVREYLQVHDRENRLALVPDGVTHFAAKDSASAEGVL